MLICANLFEQMEEQKDHNKASFGALLKNAPHAPPFTVALKNVTRQVKIAKKTKQTVLDDLSLYVKVRSCNQC